MKAKIWEILGFIAILRCSWGGLCYMGQVYEIGTTFDFWFTVLVIISLIAIMSK